MAQKYGIQIQGGVNPPNRPSWVCYNDGLTVGLMQLFDLEADAQSLADSLAADAPTGIAYVVVPVPNPPIGSAAMEAELRARAGIK
jgi:hypothetical protein